MNIEKLLKQILIIFLTIIGLISVRIFITSELISIKGIISLIFILILVVNPIINYWESVIDVDIKIKNK